MALNEQKRKFAAALKSGMTQEKAAIHAGYSEKTARSKGNQLAKDPDVLAEIARKEAVAEVKQEAKEKGIPINLSEIAGSFKDPKDFLVAVMNDIAEDPKLRLDAAKTLMPYVHARKADAGIKDTKQKAAEKVSSRFAPSAPPRLVVNGGKKV